MARNKPVIALSQADRDYVRGLVVYEDEVLIGFDKPSGLPVQTRGNRGRNLDHLLWAFARSNGKRPRLVHRIDTGTSGLVIAAKTKPAAVALSEAFAARRVTKVYLALVRGRLPEQVEGVVRAPLISASATPPASRVCQEGEAGAQTAETKWRILKRDGQTALVEARPITGRMHQIRVHLASLGCAILGDHLYGDKASAPRLMLHALSLALPTEGGDQLRLEASPPEAFHSAARRAGIV